ncbi:MAG: hypothetical protein AAFU65_05415, partial [Pseudomonadota bacterium]
MVRKRVQLRADLADGKSELLADQNETQASDVGRLEAPLTARRARRPHQIFSNGKRTDLPDGGIKIEFPEHFTTSSPYLDVIDPAKFEIVSE